jgi:glyoxylase-like metal-dependent hydrolase (beta-lactamase superfamily II)
VREERNMMPQEVARDIYRIEIPLPRNPLKALNSYIIKGKERHLVVDCGMRRNECRDALLFGLRALGVELRDTDFFITHFHADHLGLVSDLVTPETKIYLNEPDAIRTDNPGLKAAFARAAGLHGFPGEEIDRALEAHPGSKYGPDMPLSFVMPRDGEIIGAGSYHFTCLTTPGHSFGHQCLYESDYKILIAGDHILDDITPNIQCWFDDWNPLAEYLKSLDMTAKLDVGLVLPGHRRLFTHLLDRIEELKAHHDARVEEAATILKKGPMTAYQMASLMNWDIVCDSFDQFPVSQKWFATGEAIAHLVYLEGIGRARPEQAGKGTRIWRLTNT